MSNLSSNTPAANQLTSNLETLQEVCSRQAFYITSKAILIAMRLYSLCLLQQESLSSAASDLCSDIVDSVLQNVLDKIAEGQNSGNGAKLMVKRLSNESIFAECRRWLFALRDPLRGMKSTGNGSLSDVLIFSDCLEWLFAEGDALTAQLPQKQPPVEQQRMDEEFLTQGKAQPPQQRSEMSKINLAQGKGKLADEETRLAGKAPNNFLASSSTSLASSDYDVEVDAALAANREWNNVQLSQTWASTSTSQEDAKPKKKRSKLGRLFSCMFCCFRRKSQRVRYSQ